MGSQFVLHDDEVLDKQSASVFEVEQPPRAAQNGKASLQRLKRPTVDVFIGEDKEIMSLEGFQSPWYKQLLFVVLGICTFGLMFLISKWSLKVRTALRLRHCPLKEASYVRVTVSCSIALTCDEKHWHILWGWQPIGTCACCYFSASQPMAAQKCSCMQQRKYKARHDLHM
eukprot:GHRR01023500.1.p1 GENE.GHRR01023500.1~~GHRR01023500.1.p1  ORF type:complete len:171 (+),score=28.77 GHRR01023500.1:311-823(+)